MEGYLVTGTSLYYDLYEDNEYWVIDNDKNIKAPKEITIMQGDTNSQYIPFMIERYYDGIDLSEKQFSIIWNTEQGGDSSLAVNSYMNDSHVVFAWLLDGPVTNNSGDVAFQIQATGLNEKDDSYVYLSNIKVIHITPSLDAKTFITEQPQLYNDLMNYVQGVLDGSTGTIYAKLSRNLAVMEARISEIAATAGTNTADTEIADARVRLNGTPAACIGDEIRAKADGFIYENGRFYLTSAGQKISDGIQFTTDLSGYLTKEQVEKKLADGSLVKRIEQTDTGFTVVMSDDTDFAVEIKAGGLAFDSGYQDDEGNIHLTYNDNDIDGFIPFKIAGGGGGAATGSKTKVSMYTPLSFSVLESAGKSVIKGNFSSVDAETGVDTGAGTLSVSVAGVIKENRTIQQGDFEVDVFKYLNTGTNSIKLLITDSYGTSVARNFTIVKEVFEVTWSLGTAERNTGTLSFYITPTGSGDKTIHLLVDGEEKQTQTVATSGRRVSLSVENLSHGSHLIEVYAEMVTSGTTLQSNHLKCAIAQTVEGSTDPMIAVNWPESLAQYTTVTIPFVAVDPRNNPTTISFLVNGEVYATEELDQALHTWSYRPMTSGTFKLGIMCGSKLEEKQLTIEGIGSDVGEIMDGLDIKVEPSSMTKLADWKYGKYGFTLSDGFDEINGGLTTDKDGVHCIRIIKGDRLTLNYPLFSTDTRKNGKEMKFIYTVENSTRLNAEAISCLSDGIGVSIRANDVECTAEQTSVIMDTCEGIKTELDINIQQDKEDRLMSIWESCSSFAYSQYSANENFTQSNPVGVTFGSDYCDVLLYLFRAYTRDLTDSELRANYAADGKDGDEILARNNRNQIYDSTGRIDLTAVASLNPNLHVMTWHSDRFSLGKKDGVNGRLTHVYTAGGAGHNWTAYMTINKVQGTSSVEHAPTAGGNQDFDLTQGITLEEGGTADGYAMSATAIPVPYFTFKKNIASQDHITNSAMAEWYQRYQPSVRAARKENPGVRDCMESQMAVVFFHNTENTAIQIGPDLVQPDETIFYGLGNLCNSKKNNEAFKYEPIVIEVKNNTEAPVRFKSDDLSNFDDNFEFRYLDKSKYTEEQAIALFQELVTFVHACDYTAATNTALPKAVSFNGQAFTVDSAEYRKAKWKAEAWDHMDKESILYHQNFTLHYLGRDSRAKNMFWAYDPDTKKWDLRFLWDLDTFLGVNNEGFLDIQPGHLDTDVDGTKDVFNAADNVIFINNTEVFWDDLRENYLACESAGAWDYDKLADYCDEMQSYACEALWVEDVEHNDIRTLTNLGTNAYLARATGKKRLQRRKSLKLQGAFVASYYLSTAATADSVSMRGYTPSQWTGVRPNGIVNVTPYCNLFVNTHAGSIDRKIRANAGETVQIDLTSALNDTEIYFRSAEWLQSLGDLSGLYIGDCNLSKMTRLTRAEIGSDVDGYKNTNFQTASFDNCASLEFVNLAGLPNAKQAFDFKKNLMLEEIHSKGSGITGLTFAKNGRLKVAKINAVSSLVLSNLRQLETLEMEGYDALASLTVEECPTVDTYTLVKTASNLQRIRLLDINWSVPVAAYDVLKHLDSIQGIDDDGYTVDEGVVTGTVYFPSISISKFEDIRSSMPTVNFTYGQLLEEHTVTFKNDDGTVLYVGKTEHGGSIPDPIKTGLITAPTKDPSVELTYEYYKWDVSLDAIMEDTDVTATYREYPRTYTVRYLDKDGTELEKYTVDAHGSCSYQGVDLEQAGYIWTGWDKTTDDVVANMDVNAVYIYPSMPKQVQDLTKFDYAYSDDPADKSAYSFGELYSIMKTGRTATYLPIKSKIKMQLKTDVIADTELVFNLHAIGHYRLADGSAMSNADWYMTGVLNANRRVNPTNNNTGGWDKSELRTWMNETLFKAMPSHWRQMIVESITLASAGAQSATIVSSKDHLRIPSHVEVGFDVSAVPYVNEIDSSAAEKTFSQYTDNNSRIKKQFNGGGSAQWWWLRSADAGGAVVFRAVFAHGTSLTGNADNTNGVCVGFSV